MAYRFLYLISKRIEAIDESFPKGRFGSSSAAHYQEGVSDNGMIRNCRAWRLRSHIRLADLLHIGKLDLISTTCFCTVHRGIGTSNEGVKRF